MSSMDTTPDPLPPEFKPEEQELIDALKKVKGGFKLDQMLIGAIRALKAEDNPDSFAHAAQSARVLIEKFEHGMHGQTAASLNDKRRENFKVRTDRHGKKWKKTKKDSEAFATGEWRGKIDTPLQEFLGEVDDFFEWYANHDIYRKNKEEAVVLHLDPMFSALSQSEQRRIVREWVDLRGFFNNVAHHNEREVTLPKMEEALARLVRYLHRRLAPVDVANKAAILAHIKECEARTVVAADVERLKTLLDSGADAALFFSSLKSPAWLASLQQAGYFDSPPEPQKKEGMELHPVWPQIGYLIQMATAAPAEVADILAAMPITKNDTLNEGIFRAAANLPASNVAPVVSRIHRWLKPAQIRWRSTMLGKFLRHVTQSGNTKGAAGMLADILQFSPGVDPNGGKPKKRGLFNWTPDPTTRLESHEYGEVLRTAVPELAKAAPRRTMAMLCRVLAGYIDARGRTKGPSGYDGSVYWRPSIEDSSQNSSFDEVTDLIAVLRDLVDEKIKSGRLSLAEVLEVTGEFRWDIFRRLEMHWIRNALDQATPAMLRAALVRRTYLCSERFELEYGRLLNAAFSRLGAKDRASILRWIAEGPDISQSFKRKPAAKFRKEFEDWSNRWRTKKCYWIKDALPAHWRERYRLWAKKGWEPDHPGFNSWSEGVQDVTHQSPISLDVFQSLMVPKQVEYLRAWIPSEDNWRGPSRAGLAGILNAAISAKLETYIEQADAFIGASPEYVGTLLSALWEKLKTGAPQSMAAVWRLADWVLQLDDAETDIHDDFMRRTYRGRRWYSVRLALARLLHSLLRSPENPLPIAHRERVWALLSKLAKDPDPTAKARAEAGDDESHSGPFNNSLNTIRGEAFHAVFEYIGWVKTASPALIGLPPDVKQLLQEHLDSAVEPTRTIRSVYGANINRLGFWDSPWLKEQRAAIFPSMEPLLASAAWATFITHCRPYLDVFRLLQPEFLQATQSLGASTTKSTRGDPRVHLGRYLVVLYWSGHLDFEVPDDLMADFFRHAPDDVRGDVMDFIGRSLKQTAGPIETAISTRLRRFWEWRLAAGRAAPQDHKDELSGFAWWFESGKLDEHWAAQQMVEALALSRRHANQFLWMRRFAEMSERETALAVRALELTCEIAREAGERFWNDEEAKVILSAGLKSPDAAVVEQARRIQDAFCREGKTDFMNLP